MEQRSTFKSKALEHRQLLAWLLVAIWAAAIFYVSAQPATRIPDSVRPYSAFLHFCAYWLLAVLVIGALDMPWRRSWKTAVLAILIASLYAATDEFHQTFVAGRVCDVLDWLVDTSGGVLGSLAGTWFLTVFRLYRKPDAVKTESAPEGLPVTEGDPAADKDGCTY